MSQETSRLAYNTIKNNGLLNKLQLEVYGFIYNCGPCTQREASQQLRGHSNYSVPPRFTELHEMGVIEPVGTRKCSVTGKQCIIWEATDKLPERPSPQRKLYLRIEKAKAKVKQLEDEYFRKFLRGDYEK